MTESFKIPRGLALALIGCKTDRKAVGSWLVLKAEGDGGQCGPVVSKLADACRCHIKTLRTRLSRLQQLELIYYDNQNNLRLASWDKLFEVYRLSPKARFRNINIPENEKCKPEHLLIALAIEEKKKQCSMMAQYRLNKIPELKSELKAMLGAKYIERSALTQRQLDSYFSQDAIELGDRYMLNLIRMDEELGYKRWSELIGYNGIGSFAYLKRSLAALGLLKISKRAFFDPSAHLTTSAARTNTRLGTPYYCRPMKAVVLTLPDFLRVTLQQEKI